MKKYVPLGGMLAALIILISCSGGGGESSQSNSSTDDGLFTVGSADQGTASERLSEDADLQDLSEMVDAVNQCGIVFYKSMAEEDVNVSLSPYSIFLVLAAAREAAEGRTLEEMENTLYPDLNPDNGASILNCLDLNINDNAVEGNFLKSVNSAWGQEGFSLYRDFYTQLSGYFGITIHSADFAAQPLQTKENIEFSLNEHSLFEFIFPSGTFSNLTRLVLLNLTGLQGVWETPFNPELTHSADFLKTDHTRVMADFMSRTGIFRYAETEEFQAVEIPFEDARTSLLLVMPDAEEFSTFQTELAVADLEDITGLLEPTQMMLDVPSFSMDSTCHLKSRLQSMGIHDGFDPERADFSRATTPQLVLENAVSQTRIRMIETSWTSEGRTALTFDENPYFLKPVPIQNGDTGLIVTMPPIIFPEPIPTAVFDHPFLYFIRDTETGVILFMGSFLDPAK